MRVWAGNSCNFCLGLGSARQPLTLTRSSGCVQHAAPQDATPPKYHRDTRFSAMIPRCAAEAQKLLQCLTRQLSPAGLEGAAEPTTALIFKHFDKRTRWTSARVPQLRRQNSAPNARRGECCRRLNKEGRYWLATKSPEFVKWRHQFICILLSGVLL